MKSLYKKIYPTIISYFMDLKSSNDQYHEFWTVVKNKENTSFDGRGGKGV